MFVIVIVIVIVMAFVEEVAVPTFLGLMDEYKAGWIQVSRDLEPYLAEHDHTTIAREIGKGVQPHVEELAKNASDLSGMKY